MVANSWYGLLIRKTNINHIGSGNGSFRQIQEQIKLAIYIYVNHTHTYIYNIYINTYVYIYISHIPITFHSTVYSHCIPWWSHQDTDPWSLRFPTGSEALLGRRPLRRDAHSCFEMGTSKGIKRGNHLQYLLFIVGNHMKSLSSKLIDELSTYKKCKKHCNEKWGNIIFQ